MYVYVCVYVCVYIYTACTCRQTVTNVRVYTGPHLAAALQAAPRVLAQARRRQAAPAAHREYILQVQGS